MPDTVHFRSVGDEGKRKTCAACDLESGRIQMLATHRMQYTDSGNNERDYFYCPRHANRIAVDMRITGHDVFIDDVPIELPIEFDVESYVQEHKSKWRVAHEQAKREYSKSGATVRPQNTPKTKAKRKPTTKPDKNFQWI